jgi:hypothetical protein
MWRYKLLSDKQADLENLGRLDEAADALAAMAAHAEACDSDAMRADVITSKMLWADREGRAAEAESMARDALALAEPAQAPAPAALAHGELAWLSLSRRQFETSLKHITLGLRWARECSALPWRDGGYVGYEYQLRVIGVEALLHQQRWGEARAAIAEALETLPLRRRRERLSLLLQRVRAESHMGEPDVARRTCDEGAALAASLNNSRLSADVANALAQMAALYGDFTTAERAAMEAEVRAREMAHSVGLAEAWDSRAGAAAARGEIAAARALWADAQRQYEEQGMPPEALAVRAELAELDRREGRIEAAVSAALSVLTEGQGDTAGAATDRRADPWPLLEPPVLLRCHTILAAAGRAQAAPVLHELQRRLQHQLAQLPDDSARKRLVQALPQWRETVRLGEQR